jgi:hypothetical protein
MDHFVDWLVDWLRGKITGDLEEIPGIGTSNKAILKKEGITNTYHLIGKYLSLKKGDIREHQNAMYEWLTQINVTSGRNYIILALSEKCEILFPTMGKFDIEV